MTTAEEYRTALTTPYGQAMFELDAGGLRQAPEKLWSVSAQAFKSLAERRGWWHGLPGEFYRILGRLRNEMNVAELRQQFPFASELHTNFYENRLGESEIREIAIRVQGFVKRLARL